MELCSKLCSTLIWISLLYLVVGCSSATPADTVNDEPAATESTASKQAVEKTVQESPPTAPATATATQAPDTITLASNLKKIGQATGDLNKDGQAEKVLVVEDLNSSDEYSHERRLQIYHLVNGQWNLWEDIAGGLLGSADGGMMGDPFEAITIERGVIVIKHFGGSRQKWSYTHRFRYQNKNWELIGATINFGAVCDNWQNYDYNLSIGTIEAEKTTVNCDTDEDTTEKYTFQYNTKPLPQLKGFEPGSNKVLLPDAKGDFYF